VHCSGSTYAIRSAARLVLADSDPSCHCLSTTVGFFHLLFLLTVTRDVTVSLLRFRMPASSYSCTARAGHVPHAVQHILFRADSDLRCHCLSTTTSQACRVGFVHCSGSTHAIRSAARLVLADSDPRRHCLSTPTSHACLVYSCTARAGHVPHAVQHVLFQAYNLSRRASCLCTALALVVERICGPADRRIRWT
jgi:hypothetical protein